MLGWISLLVIPICILYYYKKTTNFKINKKYPKGEYVLKIIINKNIKDNLNTILDIMKNELLDLVKVLMEDKKLYIKWRKSGEAKIVLSGTNEDMEMAYRRALDLDILVSKKMVGEIIGIVVVGPGLKSEINEFTCKFRLF
jgi:peptidyl-tRNA hydrolase